MRNKTALEELSTKVLLLVERYNKTKDENIALNKKIETLNKEVEKLREEDELKNMEIEDMTQKITKMLA